MNRFYFNLHECGDVTTDEEGCELPGLDAAHKVALIQARSIMSAEVQDGRLCLSCRIEVLDADGRLALTVPFTEALALSGV